MVKKIHPYDAYLLLSNSGTIDLIKKEKAEPLPGGEFIIDGISYQQTTEVPPSEEAKRIFLNG